MKILSIVSVFLTVMLGALTSYTDIRYKKAYNYQIGIFVATGIPIQIISVAIGDVPWQVPIINIALAIIISILFYGLKIWAAGDSKLFIAMILLIPYSLYGVSKEVFFPAFYILEFGFTLAVIYVIVESLCLLCIDLKNGKKYSANGILPKLTKDSALSWAMAFLLADTCDMLLMKCWSDVFAENTYLLIIINILIAIILLNSIEKWKPKLVLSCVLLVFRFSISLVTRITFSPLTVWTVLIVFVTIMVRNFTSQYNYREIPTSKVEVGNVLSRSSLVFMLPSLVKGLPRYTDETTRCRLNAEEVDAIKRWEHSKYGQSTITIVRTLPFAPFIFGGALLCGVFKLCLRM